MYTVLKGELYSLWGINTNPEIYFFPVVPQFEARKFEVRKVAGSIT